MANDKFDDTRESIQKLISVFYNSNILSKYRNMKFEQDVLQIINRKTISNFEFFANVFDSIYDYNLTSENDFYKYMVQEIIQESKGKKLSKLFTNMSNLDDRDQTIKLAYSIYNQHQAMIRSFEDFYSDNQKNNRISDNKIFDYKFLSNFKHIDISFDVFLSHRYYLRFYNIIVFYVLTVHYGLSVYVDWIFDHSVDRRKLDENTVKLLKYRMYQSRKLVFFNLINSNTTNWMAWEVGYFSCLKENSIAILDLDGYCTGNKNVEVLSSNERIILDDKKRLRLQTSGMSIEEWI